MCLSKERKKQPWLLLLEWIRYVVEITTVAHLGVLLIGGDI